MGQMEKTLSQRSDIGSPFHAVGNYAAHIHSRKNHDDDITDDSHFIPFTGPQTP
jgi:hypothetical protein